jgi:hypothetical protein
MLRRIHQLEKSLPESPRDSPNALLSRHVTEPLLIDRPNREAAKTCRSACRRNRLAPVLPPAGAAPEQAIHGGTASLPFGSDCTHQLNGGGDASHIPPHAMKTKARRQPAGRIPPAAMLRLHRIGKGPHRSPGDDGLPGPTHHPRRCPRNKPDLRSVFDIRIFFPRATGEPLARSTE